MNLENKLNESIDQGVDSFPRGVPDLDRIRTKGRRRTAVRVAVPALAAAAVITAVTVGVQAGLGSGDGGTTADLPVAIQGQGHAAAYITGGNTLNWDGLTTTATHAESLGMSAMTKAGLVYVGDDNIPYLIDKTGAETALGESLNPGTQDWSSSISSDTAGNRVAWSTNGDKDDTGLQLVDATTGSVLASTTVNCSALVGPGAECDITAVHDERVYFDAYVGEIGDPGNATFVWDPSRPESEQIYALTDPGTTLVDVGANTLALRGNGQAYGGPDHQPLDPAITVKRVKGPAYNYRLSPNSDWALDDLGNDETEMGAINLKTDQQVIFEVPDGIHGQAMSATFDDDGSVLVARALTTATDYAEYTLLDCALPSGQCTTLEESEQQEFWFPGFDDR